MSSSARENSLDIGNLRYSDRSNSDRSNSSHSESRGRFLSLRRSTSVIEQHPITAIAEEGDRNDEQAEEVAASRGELQKTKKELDDKMDMVLLLLRKMQPTPTPAERDSDSPNLPDFAA
ncbi:expressed unknown protein [Seminavis robusta]|uniref:Uncharacterized protein n=1 Tax=Seminavis robusta TaxID=568900 RepID=A0A9N8EL53_9STRA|nr:expressed unknown protein [Seminavis robusta]|eukprot:Sro1333_g263640.1 n/a (119) ;mRNA; f:9957-10403